MADFQEWSEKTMLGRDKRKQDRMGDYAAVWEDEANVLPPHPDGLAAWLEERQKELNKLERLEVGFLASHDPAALKEFWPKMEYPKVELREPIEGPVALFDDVGFRATGKTHNFDAEKWIETRNQCAKQYFPGLTIKEVKLVNGETRMAYIGVSTATLNAATKLFHQKQKLAREVTYGAELLGQANRCSGLLMADSAVTSGVCHNRVPSSASLGPAAAHGKSR